jgi:hypothetical protein
MDYYRVFVGKFLNVSEVIPVQWLYIVVVV